MYTSTSLIPAALAFSMLFFALGSGFPADTLADIYVARKGLVSTPLYIVSMVFRAMGQLFHIKRLTSTPVGANDSKVVALILQALETAPAESSGQVQPEGAGSSGGITATFRGYTSFLVLLCGYPEA